MFYGATVWARAAYDQIINYGKLIFLKISNVNASFGSFLKITPMIIKTTNGNILPFTILIRYFVV